MMPSVMNIELGVKYDSVIDELPIVETLIDDYDYLRIIIQLSTYDSNW